MSHIAVAQSAALPQCGEALGARLAELASAVRKEEHPQTDHTRAFNAAMEKLMEDDDVERQLGLPKGAWMQYA